MLPRTLFVLSTLVLGFFFFREKILPKTSADFQAVLWQLDTATITAINWHKGSEREVMLVRTGKQWVASQGTSTTKAVPIAVEEVLAALLLVQTDKVVTQDKQQWADFGVDEKNGIRVKIFEEEQVLKDVVISNFTETDSLGRTITFLRQISGNAVYQVNGELSLVFQRPFDGFRNQQVLLLDNFSIPSQLEYFLTPDSSIQFVQKENLQEELDEMPVDSLTLSSYLQQLQHLSSTDFATNFDETQAEKHFYRKVRFPFGRDTLQLTCYRDTTLQPQFIIHSSQNAEAYFSSDSSGLFQRIFQPLEQWRELPEKKSTL